MIGRVCGLWTATVSFTFSLLLYSCKWSDPGDDSEEAPMRDTYSRFNNKFDVPTGLCPFRSC
ncbi:hypothetical protein ACP4OV_017176 [Aristida adscensionis]